MDNIFVRYAISAVSVFLISFFVYEQQAADLSSSTSISRSSNLEIRGTVLDYGKFRNTYIKFRNNRPTVALSSRYSYIKSEQVERK